VNVKLTVPERVPFRYCQRRPSWWQRGARTVPLFRLCSITRPAVPGCTPTKTLLSETVEDVNTGEDVVTVSMSLLCVDLAGDVSSVNVECDGNEPPTVGAGKDALIVKFMPGRAPRQSHVKAPRPTLLEQNCGKTAPWPSWQAKRRDHERAEDAHCNRLLFAVGSRLITA